MHSSNEDGCVEKEATRVLFLTNNPGLSSTARILKAWLQLGQAAGLRGAVIGKYEGDLLNWMTVNGFQSLLNPMPWPEYLRPWKSMWHVLHAAYWAREFRPDVIHCNEHDVYPFAGLLRRLFRCPLVCHVRYRLDRDFAEWAFGGRRKPDALLWTSYQQQRDSAEAVSGVVPEHQQHVLRLGIDLERFGRDYGGGKALRRQWEIQDDEILIGIPSPLRPRKRVEDFVEIIRRLGSKYEKIVGVIAGGEISGDEDYRHRIERKVSESGLGRRLRWVGNLEPVEPFHHACDISVSTSCYETFGNSVCEAMACGKPVAAYQGGSVGEVVGQTGLVEDTGDIDGLTRAVERLVVDSELRGRLGRAARQRVAIEFNPANSLRQLHDIYHSLLRPITLKPVALQGK